jgi:hypothetical protein
LKLACPEAGPAQGATVAGAFNRGLQVGYLGAEAH